MLQALILAVVLLTTASPAVDTSADLAGASLTIVVKGVDTDKGHVLAALYTSAETWPKPDAAHATAKVKARRGGVTITFDELARGQYAIALMHDENDDGAMTYSMIGIPKEAYGFGNDARATFSAPSFGESLVTVDGQVQVSVTVK